MTISRKACRVCQSPAEATRYISGSGLCQTCAVTRVALNVRAVYPPGDEFRLDEVVEAVAEGCDITQV